MGFVVKFSCVERVAAETTWRDLAHGRNDRSFYELSSDSLRVMDFTRPVQAVIPGAQGRILAVQSRLKQLKSLVQDPAGVIEGVT